MKRAAHPHPLIQRLRQERVRQGRTQVDLGVHAGIHDRQLAKYELGINNPTLPSLDAWVTALGMKLVLE